jgi:hypothetical protein
LSDFDGAIAGQGREKDEQNGDGLPVPAGHLFFFFAAAASKISQILPSGRCQKTSRLMLRLVGAEDGDLDGGLIVKTVTMATDLRPLPARQ